MKDSALLRDLGEKELGHLVEVQGVVVHVSSVFPQISTGLFRCVHCHHEMTKDILYKGYIEEPQRCPQCAGFGTMMLQHILSTYR